MAIFQNQGPKSFGGGEALASLAGNINDETQQRLKNKLQLALESSRIQQESEARQKQAAFEYNQALVPGMTTGPLAGLLGATPEQQKTLSGLGSLHPVVLDTALKALAAEQARKEGQADKQTSPQEIRDENGLLVRTEHVNRLGTPVKVTNNPSYNKDKDSLEKLNSFQSSVNQLKNLYDRVSNQPMGAGFGRGAIKGLEGTVGLNPEADALSTLGKQLMGQFTQELENIPGGRFSVGLAKIGKSTPITAGTNKETVTRLLDAYDKLMDVRKKSIFSSSNLNSSSPGSKSPLAPVETPTPTSSNPVMDAVNAELTKRGAK